MKVLIDFLVYVLHALELAESLLSAVLFGVDFDTVETHGQQALGIFTEVYDKLLGVNAQCMGFILGIGNRIYYRKSLPNLFLFYTL